MSNLKLVLIGCGLMVALSPVANAAELRLGNGSTWVTVGPSSGPADTSGSVSRSQELPVVRGSNGHI